MAASKFDIKGWFEQGVEQGSAYMLIVCDTFDWEDYPVFLPDKDQALKAKAMYASGSNMQRLMEVYDLNGDKDAQLNKSRAMAL